MVIPPKRSLINHNCFKPSFYNWYTTGNKTFAGVKPVPAYSLQIAHPAHFQPAKTHVRSLHTVDMMQARVE